MIEGSCLINLWRKQSATAGYAAPVARSQQRSHENILRKSLHAAGPRLVSVLRTEHKMHSVQIQRMPSLGLTRQAVSWVMMPSRAAAGDWRLALRPCRTSASHSSRLIVRCYGCRSQRARSFLRLQATASDLERRRHRQDLLHSLTTAFNARRENHARCSTACTRSTVYLTDY